MKKTIRDYDLNNKRVIIRCDFNVPISNNKITDDTKIISSLETINYAINNNAKVILMSHLGKIKEEKDKINNSLFIVSIYLGKLLGKKVKFSSITKGKELEELMKTLLPGEVLLLENTRFEDLNGKLESSCDSELSKYWASLGDIFINDAYGTCHRKHASNYGIASLLPNGIGFLVEKEVTKIESILNDNSKPFIVIMGGKKVSDKTLMIENLITKCDTILIGGAMAFTFLKSLGKNVGKSIIEEENIEYCKNLLEKYPDKIILPIDVVVTKEINDNPDIITKNINEINEEDIGVDIGEKTIELFTKYLSNAKRVVINGPMGIFEIDKLSNGTKKIYDYIIKNNIKTLIGGGETTASVNKFGYMNKFYHVSTGGGATLEYLEGKELPGISVINNEKEG